jgi:hypothetical protein
VERISQADVLVIAVTMETFLFTALALVLTIGDVRGRVPDLPISPKQLGYAATGLVVIVGLGAAAAWWKVLGHPWPCGFLNGVEAIAVLIGIAAQPLFAWAIARGMGSKS